MPKTNGRLTIGNLHARKFLSHYYECQEQITRADLGVLESVVVCGVVVYSVVVSGVVVYSVVVSGVDVYSVVVYTIYGKQTIYAQCRKILKLFVRASKTSRKTSYHVLFHSECKRI
jgi:hypothetical protein